MFLHITFGPIVSASDPRQYCREGSWNISLGMLTHYCLLSSDNVFMILIVYLN